MKEVPVGQIGSWQELDGSGFLGGWGLDLVAPGHIPDTWFLGGWVVFPGQVDGRIPTQCTGTSTKSPGISGGNGGGGPPPVLDAFFLNSLILDNLLR